MSASAPPRTALSIPSCSGRGRRSLADRRARYGAVAVFDYPGREQGLICALWSETTQRKIRSIERLGLSACAPISSSALPCGVPANVVLLPPRYTLWQARTGMLWHSGMRSAMKPSRTGNLSGFATIWRSTGTRGLRLRRLRLKSRFSTFPQSSGRAPGRQQRTPA